MQFVSRLNSYNSCLRLFAFSIRRLLLSDVDSTDNAGLLRDYAQGSREGAFTELVRRHIDLVYSVALRRAGGEAPLAEDVVQKVFTDLAAKARTLPAQTVLAGWLYRHTCFVATSLVRAEARRRHREQAYVEMKALEENSPLDWTQLAPVLEDAMQELGDRDRDALLLRFFQQQPLRAVGGSLGISEDAARMRVDRALARLREVLARRGIRSTAGALAATISAHAVTAAPAGLVTSVAAAALSATTVGMAGLKTLTLMTTLTKTQVVALSALVIAGAAVPIWQHQQNKRLATENAALRVQTGQLAQARADIRHLNDQLKAAAAAPKAEHEELLRLRGQVGALRGIQQENEQLKAQRNRLAQELQQQANQQQTQGSADPDKQLANAKMDFAKHWAIALIMYADDHGGQFPTSLATADAYMDKAALSKAAQLGIRANQFELTYQKPFKTSDIKNSMQVMRTILMREKQPWRASGTWHRTYLFADGHVEIATSPDRDFSTWESKRLLPPNAP